MPRVAIMLELQHQFRRHQDVFAGVLRYAHDCGNWECVVDEFAGHELPTDATQPVPYDGVIARATPLLARRATSLGVPLVNVWYSTPATQVLTVAPDFDATGRESVEHLLSRGFRRFFCIGLEGHRADEATVRGVRAAAAEAGCPVEHVVTGHGRESYRSWKRVQSDLKRWIDDWETPIGVFVADEYLARMMTHVCRAEGIDVPREAAIVCWEDEQLFCTRFRPTLTAVDHGYERVGFEASRLLDRMMHDRSTPTSGLVSLPPNGVVARESTDFFAVDDDVVDTALRYVNANSRMSIGVDEVARAACVSRSTLERRFRRHLGRTVASEIRRLRLERVKRHLLESKDSVAKIAVEAGFDGTEALCHMFRRVVGTSPGEYRRQAWAQRKGRNTEVG